MRRFDETWEYEKYAGFLNEEEELWHDIQEREREEAIAQEQAEAMREDAHYERLHGLDK